MGDFRKAVLDRLGQLATKDDVRRILSEVLGRRPRKAGGAEKAAILHGTDRGVARRREETRVVLHEINRRHRKGLGSYASVIAGMMRDPVWGVRMKHMGARTWKSRAIENKARQAEV